MGWHFPLNATKWVRSSTFSPKLSFQEETSGAASGLHALASTCRAGGGSPETWPLLRGFWDRLEATTDTPGYTLITFCSWDQSRHSAKAGRCLWGKWVPRPAVRRGSLVQGAHQRMHSAGRGPRGQSSASYLADTSPRLPKTSGRT